MWCLWTSGSPKRTWTWSSWAAETTSTLTSALVYSLTSATTLATFILDSFWCYACDGWVSIAFSALFAALHQGPGWLKGERRWGC